MAAGAVDVETICLSLMAGSCGRPGLGSAAAALERAFQDSARSAVRERLLEAARELFTRHGYDGVSMRRLARDAGATPAMIHYYFGDKQGLYEALLERALSRVLGRVRGIVAADGEDMLAMTEGGRTYSAAEIEECAPLQAFPDAGFTLSS